MHNFPELGYRCAGFTLSFFVDAEEKTLQALDTSAATPFIKTLQMIRLNKTILAVGIFSVFEAMLRNASGVPMGLRKQKRD